MQRTVALLGIAGAGLLMAACATTHETVTASAANALAQPVQPASAETAEVYGLTSMGWRDAYTGTALFERAAAEYPTIQNKFNLATGYQQTGRLAQAAALYLELVRDGQFTWLHTTPDNYDPKARAEGFNVAFEAQRRLNMIPYTYVIAPTAGETVTTETVTAAPAPASTAAAAPSSAISWEQAVQLDAANAQGRPAVTH